MAPPQRTLVKHAPHKLTNQNTIYLSTRTPLVSGLKRVSKLLLAKNVKQIKVNASGKAIQKALCLALKLKSQGYAVDIYTKTVKVLDEHISNEGAETTERLIGAVELKVKQGNALETQRI